MFVDLEPITIGFLAIGLLLVLIYGGLYVGVALTTVSFVGMLLLRGDFGIASQMLSIAASDAIASYIFGVIPLFVLMGMLVGISGIGEECFDVADRMLQRLAGGLGIATVAANAVFAAITGISIAAAAVFTRIAVPQMIRFGYRAKFAVGVVAGSSVLGMLIPPSLLFILYGIITETSIGDLFLAGVLPGLALTAVYCIYIVLAARFRPGLIYQNGLVPNVATRRPAVRPMEIGRALAPVGLLVLFVIGGIYGGHFTPTEAGAVGALCAFVITAFRGRLDRAGLWKVLVDTGQITASVCLLLIGASLFSRFLALSGLPQEIAELFHNTGLGVAGFIAIYLVILLVLGCILDSSSTMLILVPIAFPVSTSFGIDPHWFGVITVVAVEIGLLTPPFGLSVFVVRASLSEDAPVSTNQIFAGTFPFVLLMAVTLALILAFPWLATGLLTAR
ncbi:TRAP transporter large permease [Phreatobacter sp.]|uniref:TRAP transporter large permease n=1 Tax=Phreatobacter sp. TaxID=1966341 RepID=UPI003F6F82C2